MFVKKYWHLLRPLQWIKNLLVFAPLFFALRFEMNVFGITSGIFIAFSLVASATYIVNDILDLELDKKHPQKKFRPLASGLVDVRLALVIFFVLLFLGLGLASFISLKIFLILVLYLFMNLLYSKWLKYVPVIDVMLIAIGFVLRILSGAIATNILLSPWIILCTFFGALFLGFGKRKSEINNLKSDSEKTRSILSFYEHNFLNQLLGLAAGITITSYTLYTIDQNTINHFQTTGLIYTIPFVVFGVCRFFQIIYTQSAGENPTKVFLTDRPILLNTLLWILAFGLIILF